MVLTATVGICRFEKAIGGEAGMVSARRSIFSARVRAVGWWWSVHSAGLRRRHATATVDALGMGAHHAVLRVSPPEIHEQGLRWSDRTAQVARAPSAEGSVLR